MPVKMLAASSMPGPDDSAPCKTAVIVQAVDGTPEADAALKGAVHRVRDIHSRCILDSRLTCRWLCLVTTSSNCSLQWRSLSCTEHPVT